MTTTQPPAKQLLRLTMRPRLPRLQRLPLTLRLPLAERAQHASGIRRYFTSRPSCRHRDGSALVRAKPREAAAPAATRARRRAEPAHALRQQRRAIERLATILLLTLGPLPRLPTQKKSCSGDRANAPDRIRQ